MTRWVWTAASGLTTELNAWDLGNYVTVDGTDGVLAPEYEFTTQQLAGVDGADVQSITARPASPVLGLDMTASDPVELRSRLRALVHALAPRAGIGRLTAVADDGSARHVDCYYRKGLERGIPHAVRYRTVLEFWAPSPWWRGEPLTDEWSLAAPGVFFPILPLRLSASTIAGGRTFDLSDTDAPTYPTWTVTGPGTQLTLANDTTGAQLVLTPPGGIGDGELVVIDTRPGWQSIRRGTRPSTSLAEQRRNLAGNPRAASLAGWLVTTTGGSPTVSAISGGIGAPNGITTATRGTFGAVPTSVAASVNYGGTAETGYQVPVTPGQTIAGSLYGRTSRAGQTARARFIFLDAAGGTLATIIGADTVTTAADTWFRVGGTATAPAGAARVRTDCYYSGGATWAPGDTIDATGALVESGDVVGVYFDGDIPDTGSALGDVHYGWSGTAHASQSVAQTIIGGGDPILGESLFGSLASDPAMFPLVPGINAVTVLLTNAGPASRIELAADRLYSGAL